MLRLHGWLVSCCNVDSQAARENRDHSIQTRRCSIAIVQSNSVHSRATLARISGPLFRQTSTVFMSCSDDVHSLSLFGTASSKTSA